MAHLQCAMLLIGAYIVTILFTERAIALPDIEKALPHPLSTSMIALPLALPQLNMLNAEQQFIKAWKAYHNAAAGFQMAILASGR